MVVTLQWTLFSGEGGERRGMESAVKNAFGDARARFGLQG